jgi:hypothetical protein
MLYYSPEQLKGVSTPEKSGMDAFDFSKENTMEPRISFVLAAAAVLVSAQSACAYLDAGTGSYIVQILIGFVVGGLYALKVFWKKIVTFFRSIFRKDATNAPNS